MKKFAFSLQKVLNFKEQMLDVLKSELAALQHDMRELDEKIVDLEKVFVDTNETLVAQMSAGITSGDIAVYKIYLTDVTNHVKQILEEKEKLQLVIAKKQTEIISANIEIASFEKLKERQLEDYRKAEAKSAEIELNEFIGNMSAR